MRDRPDGAAKEIPATREPCTPDATRGSRLDRRAAIIRDVPRLFDYARAVPVLAAATLALCAACSRKPKPTEQQPTSAPASPSASTSTSASAAPPTFDLTLRRDALVAFGSTTTLPLDADFPKVAALEAPLQKVARNHPGAPGRMRVGRDVPYGQVWRVVSSGAEAGIGAWEIATPRENGGEATLHVGTGLGLGEVDCFATAWIGPDASISTGLEAKGVLVRAAARRPPIEPFLQVVRRLDAKCKQGELRLNSQMTAIWGPIFDVGLAVETATTPPNVRSLRLAAGHVAPVDKVLEVVGP
jgi:hypothetical protein